MHFLIPYKKVFRSLGEKLHMRNKEKRRMEGLCLRFPCLSYTKCDQIKIEISFKLSIFPPKYNTFLQRFIMVNQKLQKPIKKMQLHSPRALLYALKKKVSSKHRSYHGISFFSIFNEIRTTAQPSSMDMQHPVYPSVHYFYF